MVPVAPVSTTSSTVSHSSRWSDGSTTPTRRRSAGRLARPNRPPSRVTAPALGWRTAPARKSSVLLPAPFGPRSAQCSPGRTVQETSRRRSIPPGVQTRTYSITKTGSTTSPNTPPRRCSLSPRNGDQVHRQPGRCCGLGPGPPIISSGRPITKTGRRAAASGYAESPRPHARKRSKDTPPRRCVGTYLRPRGVTKGTVEAPV